MQGGTIVTSSSATTQYRSLVSPELFGRLTSRIVKNEGVTREVAEQIMESALGFLKLIASNPDQRRLAPSHLVDIGWHTFILYTRDYAEFCSRVNCGRFIHHEPNDVIGRPRTRGGIQRSIDAMTAAGMPFNALLWTGPVTDRKLATASDRRIAATSIDGNCTPDRDDGTGSEDPDKCTRDDGIGSGDPDNCTREDGTGSADPDNCTRS